MRRRARRGSDDLSTPETSPGIMGVHGESRSDTGGRGVSGGPVPTRWGGSPGVPFRPGWGRGMGQGDSGRTECSYCHRHYHWGRYSGTHYHRPAIPMAYLSRGVILGANMPRKWSQSYRFPSLRPPLLFGPSTLQESGRPGTPGCVDGTGPPEGGDESGLSFLLEKSVGFIVRESVGESVCV